MPLINNFREFELNITQRCNAVCEHCDRLVGVATIRGSDVTADQVKEMVARMRSTGYQPKRVKIAGGEPIVNKELPGILAAVEELRPRHVVVLTNGLREYDLRVRPNGQPYDIRVSPLHAKEHVPFLVSPTDAGLRVSRGTCSIQHKCGLAFSAFGFTMCPVADSLGHLLRINPYSQQPTSDRIMDICRHCPHSVRRARRLPLYEKAESGELPHPTPTLMEGLKRFREEPISYPRFAEPSRDAAPPRAGKQRKPSLPIVFPTGYRSSLEPRGVLKP